MSSSLLDLPLEELSREEESSPTAAFKPFTRAHFPRGTTACKTAPRMSHRNGA